MPSTMNEEEKRRKKNSHQGTSSLDFSTEEIKKRSEQFPETKKKNKENPVI